MNLEQFELEYMEYLNIGPHSDQRSANTSEDHEKFAMDCVAVIPKLLAVVDAAKKAHICDGDFQDESGDLRKALEELES